MATEHKSRVVHTIDNGTPELPQWHEDWRPARGHTACYVDGDFWCCYDWGIGVECIAGNQDCGDDCLCHGLWSIRLEFERLQRKTLRPILYWPDETCPICDAAK